MYRLCWSWSSLPPALAPLHGTGFGVDLPIPDSLVEKHHDPVLFFVSIT
jgi:hypothetical protein